MRNWLIALCLLALVGEGCNALDSLVIHPLSVVHKDHEYNEQARATQQANQTNGWPVTH